LSPLFELPPTLRALASGQLATVLMDPVPGMTCAMNHGIVALDRVQTRRAFVSAYAFDDNFHHVFRPDPDSRPLPWQLSLFCQNDHQRDHTRKQKKYGDRALRHKGHEPCRRDALWR